MKKISCLVVALSLTIMFAGFALAGEDIIKIDMKKWWQKWRMIEPNYHHLGDDDIGWFVIPEPEGTYWESKFRCKKFILREANTALVKFLAHEIGFADLIINGNRIKLNEIGYMRGQQFFIYVVPIPLDMLLQGRNLTVL